MELGYRVLYSQRKKLTISVERDRSVVVRAPLGTTPERIHEIVTAKKLWLYEKIHHSQKYNELPHPPGKELVNGESMLYLGRNYRIEMTDTGEQIHFKQCFYVPKELTLLGNQVFRQWYIDKAQEKILPRVCVFAKKMGVTFNESKITDSKYQWGSCTPQNNLNFNWRLVKAPMFVIDYVVVHELAHLLEANHTPRFWNVVRTQLRQMDEAKNWLKAHGSLLDELL